MEEQRFGRLTVKSFFSRDRNHNKRWLCLCDCGNEKVVLGDKLKDGNTQSCGCYYAEFCRALVSTAEKERKPYTKKSWTAMIARCTNPKSPSYCRYGAKGVTVCDRWLHGENGESGWTCFYTDMGPRPTDRSIDRINNYKGYFLENCRWATRKEQAANKRKKVLV